MCPDHSQRYLWYNRCIAVARFMSRPCCVALVMLLFVLCLADQLQPLLAVVGDFPSEWPGVAAECLVHRSPPAGASVPFPGPLTHEPLSEAGVGV